MKVIQINSVCGIGSTGRICVGIKEKFLKQNLGENKIIYFWGKPNQEGIKCSNLFYQKIQALKSRITGNYGFTSNINTRRVIKVLEKENPDIVHLHNIHDHTVNIGKLLCYLKSKSIKTIWTLHDCGAFTAYCGHFIISGCENWINECHNCPVYKNFSWFFDHSRALYAKKKKACTNQNLYIVTPSKWLAEKVESSYLNSYPIKVINNGIDLNVFKPKMNKVKEEYGIENKYLVLGVSFSWGYSKGLDVFIELSKLLSDDYIIMLVGTNDAVDAILPSNIISIHRTDNQAALADLYSAADVFVNPTREDTFPTVNMEAIACGTPTVTFNTGGSSEIVDNVVGRVVAVDDIDGIRTAIVSICEKAVVKSEQCIQRREAFDYNNRFDEYIMLYKELCQ